MQCSPPIPVSRGLAAPSPSSLTIASANGNVLEIRDLNTLSLLHSITTSGTHISHIAWSPSSDILAAASIPSNSVVLVNPITGAILADVHDSPLPVAALSLSATGILLVAYVQSIAVTLFSVHSAKILASIPFPTYRSPSVPTFAWSPCARFLALATRKNGIHGLVVVSLANGNVLASLRSPAQLSGLSEIAGLRWLPSGNILLWSGPLDPLNYSAVALIKPCGQVLSRRSLEVERDISIQPTEVNQYSRRLSLETDYGKVGLGIKALAVNATGSLLAIGGYDSSLRIVSVARWRVIKSFGHDVPEINTSSPPVIFRERTKDQLNCQEGGENDPTRGNMRTTRRFKTDKKQRRPKKSYFQVLDADGGVEITKRVRSANAPGSNMFGVSHVEFSSDGRYISSKSDKAGNVVFIWDVANLRLSAVMILERDVRIIRWSKPVPDGDEHDGPQLAVSCGEEFVYIWRQTGAAAVAVHGDFTWQTLFKVRKIGWSHDNSALLMSDGISANAFMSVYIPR